MQNALNSIKVKAPATNAFDLTHDVKLSCRFGELVPVLAMECIPGDRIRIGCENLARLAPMLAPLMHRVDVRVEYFFVPNRLLWANWEKWISNGGSEPTQADPLPAHPVLKYNNTPGGGSTGYTRLMDFMGLPDPDQCPDPTAEETISALPFAAYQLIWNSYYRDENLQTSIIAEEGEPLLDDGDNTVSKGSALTTIRNRAWEADYFTKALPFAQKGEPVDLPLGVVELDASTVGTAGLVRNASDHSLAANDTLEVIGGTGTFGRTGIGPVDIPGVYDPNGTLTVGATTINDLRLAYRLQEYLEKNARGGTRYSELIRSHFNVRPEDARMQRPEYIVGVKNPIQISEVLNTTGTTEAPQGNMAGHGVSFNSGNYGKYFCSEHGYVIGLLSILPKTAYQQGIPKHFLKYEDPTQLAWPTFANLGEQPIVKREIMAHQAGGAGSDTWGYTPRYMEYKNLPNRVAGEFRTSLNFWHMGRIFDPLSPPNLNGTFVSADPTTRIFAVDTEDNDVVYAQILHHIMVVRALPFYGTPTF